MKLPFRFRVSCLLVACASPAVAADPLHYDRQVLFDNSLTDRFHYFGEGSAVKPSTVELIESKVPLETVQYHTPPNALRVAWRSGPGGDWSVRLNVRRPWGSTPRNGSELSFWCYAERGLSAAAAPRFALSDENGYGSGATSLLGTLAGVPPRQWTHVRLPLNLFERKIRDTRERVFDPTRIATLNISQAPDDDTPHTILIDDIRVGDPAGAAGAAPAAPTELKITGYDQHVELTWAPGPAGVHHYRIYRAREDGSYHPIGIQKGHLRRYADFLGSSDRAAAYRISAVDATFRESPRSTEARGRTRPMSDEELLTMVQEACFRYYWEAAHPVAGMALEIVPGDEDLVALGASGFGVMALIVGVERGFITREQGAARLQQIVRFLARADRHHGVWPHFIDGQTGKTIAHFGKFDDGGDLVETAFMIQGLLAVRQYFDRPDAAEREIRETITRLWREVEWSWYRREPDSEFLYWHWSPNHAFYINHPLVGWNETLIAYLLAIASPTHPVPASLWHSGWAGQSERAQAYRRPTNARQPGDNFVNGNSYYGIKLEVGPPGGAELFFAHFNFFGFDPRGKRDRYTNYFNNNRAIALIHQAYAIENPRGHLGYGEAAWGRSAGMMSGGGALPRHDNGTINTMASLASFPYVPEEAMKALRHFYRNLDGKLWGIYGFRDGFNLTRNWFQDVYLGLNQAPITIMIENHRTGLLWRLFMSNPEIAPALAAIGFKDDPAPRVTRAP